MICAASINHWCPVKRPGLKGKKEPIRQFGSGACATEGIVCEKQEKGTEGDKCLAKGLSFDQTGVLVILRPPLLSCWSSWSLVHWARVASNELLTVFDLLLLCTVPRKLCCASSCKRMPGCMFCMFRILFSLPVLSDA